MAFLDYCWLFFPDTDKEDPEPSVTYNRPLQEENQEENTYHVTDTQSYALTIVHPEN